MTTMSTTPVGDVQSGVGDVEEQRLRLLVIRAALVEERASATSPAVARALEMAETYLYLGLGYLRHCDDLFPEERAEPS